MARDGACSMVGFQAGAAHGYEAVGSLAVYPAVLEICRVVGRGGMLAVYTLLRKRGACSQYFALRRVYKADVMLPAQGEYLFTAHGLADCYAFRESRRWNDSNRRI